MSFDDTFLNAMTKCSWLKRCGHRDEFDFSCLYAENIEQLKCKIESNHWENICLDMAGDFSSFLCLNYRKEYQNWNNVVRSIKIDYIPEISRKIQDEIACQGLPVSILSDIQFNVLTLFMLNYYSEYYKMSNFWNQMLTIYHSGHIPCDYTKGQFVVY